MAKLGTGVLVVPQKPWHLVEEETARYRATYRETIARAVVDIKSGREASGTTVLATP